MVFHFHRLVYWPDVVKAAIPTTDEVRLFWTEHALRETVKDRYGVIPQIHRLDLNDCDIFEAKLRMDGELVSLAARTKCPGMADMDVCMVLVPQGEDILRVKTVWLNRTSDPHRTLREENYCKRWFSS